MSYNVKCPYCKEEFEVDSVEYRELILIEENFTVDCPHCDKVVIVEPHVTITLPGKECKCQLENHEWIPTVTLPKCFTEMECIHCGARRPLTDEEKTEHNIPSVKEYLDFLNKDT